RYAGFAATGTANTAHGSVTRMGAACEPVIVAEHAISTTGPVAQRQPGYRLPWTVIAPTIGALAPPVKPRVACLRRRLRWRWRSHPHLDHPADALPVLVGLPEVRAQPLPDHDVAVLIGRVERHVRVAQIVDVAVGRAAAAPRVDLREPRVEAERERRRVHVPDLER